MPGTKRVVGRPPGDRLIDLTEGAARLGYSSESLRKMLKRKRTPDPVLDDDLPPYFKLPNGHWRVWLSDLDAWVTSARDEAS